MKVTVRLLGNSPIRGANFIFQALAIKRYFANHSHFRPPSCCRIPCPFGKQRSPSRRREMDLPTLGSPFGDGSDSPNGLVFFGGNFQSAAKADKFPLVPLPAISDRKRPELRSTAGVNACDTLASMTPLRLLKLSDVPSAGLREFRAAAPWLSTILVGAAVAFCLWAGLQGGIAIGRHGALPAFIAWWIVVWLGLFWLLLANMVRKTRHADAWLLRAGDGGLYVKWRSYQNLAWGSGGEQVVFVPFRTIVSARIHRRRWNTPESRAGGVRQERSTFLELQLGAVATAELAQRLADDRSGSPKVQPAGTARWGHYPVSLEPENVLRIEWRARPRIAAIIELLRNAGVRIAGEATTKNDMLRDATDADLAELARRGDLMGLIRVLRVKDEELSLEAARARAKLLIADAEVPTRHD
ncbi:MAG: hypothetical protein HZC24_01790 [Rhodocyclales bacterium]|nr:hypothetical protein [Rhodocyclales bacterium]